VEITLKRAYKVSVQVPPTLKGHHVVGIHLGGNTVHTTGGKNTGKVSARNEVERFVSMRRSSFEIVNDDLKARCKDESREALKKSIASATAFHFGGLHGLSSHAARRGQRFLPTG
jgi:hypothetical protein